MKTQYNYMIEKWASNIAQHMQDNKEDKAIIAYGLEVFILNAIIGIVTVITAMFIGVFPTATSALLASGSLRIFTGGYHSSGPVLCMFLTVGAINFYGFIALKLGPILSVEQLSAILILVMVFSYFIIKKNAPVETPNKPIRAERRPMLKKLGLKVWFFWLVSIILLIVFKADSFSHIALAIGLGIASQTFSISGNFKRKEV